MRSGRSGAQAISRVVGPVIAAPSAATCAFPGPPSPSTMRPMPAAVNASPGRTKRGSAGCTMTGSRTATSPVAKPKRWGPLIALARSLKLVRLSGSATCTVATPSGPTSIAGL